MEPPSRFFLPMALPPTGRSIAAHTAATIDDLPESILLHILTFLPMYDAIRTSSISRRWRYLWHSIPSLSLEMRHFPHLSRSFSKTQRIFSNFVSQTLLLKQTHSPLNKFSLGFPGSKRNHRPLITSWIRYGINSGITELEIDFYDENLHRPNRWKPDCFKFDFLYIMDSPVKTVKFCYCHITVPSPNSTFCGRFLSLQSICLVGFELTDTMISDLLTLCKNLEKLSLDRFRGAKKLKICHPKLKELKVGNFRSEAGDELESSIEICSPSLRMISIVGLYVRNYCFKEVPSLTVAEVDFPGIQEKDYGNWESVVNLLSGVQCLSVQNLWIGFLGSQHVSPNPFKLNNLSHLELITGYREQDLVGLDELLLRCPSLKTMVLDYLNYSPGDAQNFKEYYWNRPFGFHIPSLRHVKMRNFRGTKTEFFVVMLLKMRRVVLEKVILIPSISGSISLEPFIVDLNYLTANYF